MHYRIYSGSSSSHAQFCVVAIMKSKAKASKKCNRPRCKNDAASPRAKICIDCFKKNAALANSKRKVLGGNTTTRRGKGVFGNSGNTTTGGKKKAAGKRSGVRRSAKRALVVKKRWLDLILARQRKWEIRGSTLGHV